MTAPKPEEWRPVVGWEGLYEVSSHGRVRSLDRYLPNPLTGRSSLRRGQELTASSARKYLSVLLSDTPRRRKTATIHRLVCEAFHGEQPPETTLVRHLNGNHLDNRADNLAWGTARENALDSTAHGTNVNFNKTHCKRGHEYTEENTYLHVKNNTTSRICRVCQRMHDSSRRGTPLEGPDDARHGTVAGYNRHKCRCDECRGAANEAQNRQRARRRLREKGEE